MSLASTGFMFLLVVFCESITGAPGTESKATPQEMNCRYNLTSCLAQAPTEEAKTKCVFEQLRASKRFK